MSAMLAIGAVAASGVVFGVTTFVFVVMTLIALAQWRKVAKARSWPQAAGTILESRVEESSDNDGGMNYAAIIRYRYTVGPNIYTGDRLAFGSRNVTSGGVWGEKESHRTVAKYPIGSSVQVHHNPNDPANAVLELRSAIAFMLALVGVIFLIVGIVVAGIILVVNEASN